MICALLRFDETADEIGAEMWEHRTKLKLLVHVNIFMY